MGLVDWLPFYGLFENFGNTMTVLSLISNPANHLLILLLPKIGQPFGLFASHTIVRL